MRRLMQTIIALPSIASSRSSKCSTMSSAISFKPLLGADQGFELRPFALELLLALDLLALGRLLEIGVELRLLGLVERQLGQPALVVDRHGGAVLHRALDVVDADVVAEDRPRVGVGSNSIGVPVKPMNEACGKASRMWRAKPSMKSYWLRCASSAITTMFRRSESSG